MEKTKKLLSMVLCIVMVLCSVPLGNFAGLDLSSLTMRATAVSVTADNAINWVKSKLGASLDYDGVYGAQCVDLIKYYYAYLGVTPVSGNGCDYATNSLPSGWTRVYGGTPQKGDILVYAGNSANPYGHVAIYESDYSTYHQNFNYKQYVQHVTYRYNGISNPYWGYIRPNWKSNSNLFTSVWSENVTKTNALLYATMDLTYVQNVGCYLGTSTAYMGTKLMDSTYSNVHTMWFNLNEYNVTLNPGTTYYYKFFVIINGVEYQSAVKSFKTQGATYTLSFNANGGTNTPGSFTGGTTYTLGGAQPTRTGYTFLGWSKSSTATTASYWAGSTLTLTSDLTLYAVWKKNHTHSYGSKITIKATCTQTGIKTYTCSCGSSYTETIPQTAHNIVTVPGKAATCTATGLTEGKKCSVCGTVTVAQQTIPATAHNIVTVPGKAATCTATGLTEGKNCSVCGTVTAAQKSIPATGHKEVTVPGKAATCTSTGLTDGKKCSVCGTITLAQRVIAKKAHTYKTTTTKATLKANGSVVTKCAVCGSVKNSKTINQIKSVKLAKTSYKYNKKSKTPTVTVKDTKGNNLQKGKDYTVKYSKGRKNVGTYQVTVTFIGNYSGTKTLTFKIVPKSTEITSLTGGKKQLTVNWDKQTTQTSGYEIAYSTSSKMKKAKKVTVKKNKTTSTKIKKLKSNKKYYVRIRTYKTVDGNKIYSSWSPVVSVKTK